jgi:aromatic ring-opening dioxygenase catalytic subunit (LigB family)
MSETLPRMPVLFLPHGGGPCFSMVPPYGPPDTWDRLAAFLRGVEAALPARPRAILAVTGHWETARPAVTTSPQPSLLFDYYGFPPHTYQLRYPAPGAPALAGRVRGLLAEAGIASDGDPSRGLDHGVFVPFMLAFPNADIPVVELSLESNLDPARHLALGRALAPLRDEGVLIATTGMSYHNLRHFLADDGVAAALSVQFDDWLAATVTAPDSAARDAGLIGWSDAPAARACHPREEHLIPLLVAAGAAGGDAGVRSYSDRVMGKALSGFRFG